MIFTRAYGGRMENARSSFEWVANVVRCAHAKHAPSVCTRRRARSQWYVWSREYVCCMCPESFIGYASVDFMYLRFIQWSWFHICCTHLYTPMHMCRHQQTVRALFLEGYYLRLIIICKIRFNWSPWWIGWLLSYPWWGTRLQICLRTLWHMLPGTLGPGDMA